MAAPLGDRTISMIVRLLKERNMDITPIHKRVIGLDIHQNKISACALAVCVQHYLVDLIGALR